MGAALALGERGRGRTAPNPNVGCVVVRDGLVVGRGWTQPGGRPHAEAMALAQAGEKSRGATVYVTLEPCAHESPRGPACSTLLVEAGVARVVIALGDPDPRTNGAGAARLRDAGIAVNEGVRTAEARRSMAGFLARLEKGRPLVTLKLATSLDGQIALASGESQWITGAPARAHTHLERSRHEAILVGRRTMETDKPGLDVRLPGLEERSPKRLFLTRHPRESGDPASSSSLPQEQPAPRFRGGDGWGVLGSPEDIVTLEGVNHLFVEGGAETAAAFLRADLVDRLLLYRAPILIGAGRAALGDIGLARLGDAHDRWRLVESRMLGKDHMEAYERA
ncbi:bifunctional diaminohydroxyphosphoribosylaminopyrimidine deaminase/5-amino-6-(5-phosphoribosylamino)uracil reductase RibD [Sphingomonas sp. HITSZ_GF]|uniref:bifunctional diaminohydroxyphosphoribosylaminopyrimidine deaminase/5-amino-6-(5-phosphoribosylamino)uracil reductase RibD n=1 Tax=Sphingomonas sp. HITSZ_GF TaxID=3037247 RepID=UPI00240DB780|nr:bifunctional diaminohydroxyphosphoribosylaminopyrimidine deaminase/5-amino-6-(5-phosphoribosylamino)uracil reductase RibD [Sphingomonas sp. HITSZ_GF]MDG2533690.1 bifunctional diaminohydroxyphosphoribosylaminopyrimidine deaminase/5-amino-6-(5-phosphoribosylamino)uracil reductase RibD [Sphingomonas sp. HITSZ_GF]